MEAKKWRTSYRIICPLPVPTHRTVSLLDAIPEGDSEGGDSEGRLLIDKNANTSRSERADGSERARDRVERERPESVPKSVPPPTPPDSLPPPPGDATKSEPIYEPSILQSGVGDIESAPFDTVHTHLDVSHSVPAISDGEPSQSQSESQLSRAPSWLKPRVDYVPDEQWQLQGGNSTIRSNRTRDTQITKSQTRTLSWRTRNISEESEFTCSTVYTDKQPRRNRFTQRRDDRRNEYTASFQRRFGTETSVTGTAGSTASPSVGLSKMRILIIVAIALFFLLLLTILLVVFH